MNPSLDANKTVKLVFGTLYPAYSSYKAVRTKNVKEYVKWMMYWIIFALFTSIETFTDLFLSFWFPFYYELKIITVIYLLSPATNGSSILYRKFVHPALTKREQEIDEYIAKAKEQGYHTVLNLGSKGVTYATSLIMQTAIKGGGGLVSHLKKSYSLSDLSENPSISPSRDEMDYHRYDDPRMMPRLPPGANNQGLFFPEVDTFQRPLLAMSDLEYYGQLPSSEEISSGYSSGDPLYYGYSQPPGDPLVRTASLGGVGGTRVRTRASTRTSLPKRGSLAEGGPTWWSPGEINESQTEPDECFFIPLTHSASLPASFNPLNHQSIISSLGPEQLIALINSAKPGFMPPPPGPVQQSNVSVIISEVSDKTEDVGAKCDASKTETSKIEEAEEEKHEPNSRIAIKNADMGNPGKESEKSDKPEKQEKLGKYNKRAAPTPPSESAGSKPDATEQDDEDFVTPSSTPKPRRKLGSSYTSLLQEIEDSKTDDARERGAKKVDEPKSKPKKKTLHLPKMSFSLWGSKSGKSGSGSDNSSVASSENIAGATPGKNDLEYFIPLKGEPEKEDP